MIDPLKLLASLIPRDPNNSGGFGPFRLPEEAQWMNHVFEHHDRYYDIGPAAGMTLAEIDWRIFKALTIAAEQPEKWMERCHRAKQICRYWPIMRAAGHYLYGRHASDEPPSQP